MKASLVREALAALTVALLLTTPARSAEIVWGQWQWTQSAGFGEGGFSCYAAGTPEQTLSAFAAALVPSEPTAEDGGYAQAVVRADGVRPFRVEGGPSDSYGLPVPVALVGYVQGSFVAYVGAGAPSPECGYYGASLTGTAGVWPKGQSSPVDFVQKSYTFGGVGPLSAPVLTPVGGASTTQLALVTGEEYELRMWLEAQAWAAGCYRAMADASVQGFTATVTVVPEPASVLLMATGLAGLVALKRQRASLSRH